MNAEPLKDLVERIGALTSPQRSLLHRRLGLQAPGFSGPSAPPATHERLAAYLVARPGSNLPSVGELRKFLAQRLPEFMIPAVFIAVDTFPLTPNGKVDRNRLAARGIRPGSPVEGERAEESARPPPETVDDRLLEIWRKALGNPSIGPDDDFFEAGGDSILAIQIIARAAQAGLNMRLTEFFQTPTVSQMAAKIRTGNDRPEDSVRPAAPPPKGPIPLSPIQHWFFEQGLGDHDRWNQARALQLPSGMETRQISQALSAVLRTHRALNHAYIRKPAGWIQVATTAHDEPEIEAVDCSDFDDNQRAEALDRTLATLNRRTRLDSGNLLHAAHLRRTSPGNDLLLVAAHHLAVDGISWTILLEDFETACTQVRRGDSIRLPTPSINVETWVNQLHAHAQTESLTAQADYWLSQPWSQAGPIPRDRNDGLPNSEASAELVRTRLTDSETRQLVASARSVHAAEVNEIVLAALCHALSAWMQSDSVLIGIEGHGREPFDGSPDVSRTVGWFTSFFPVLFSPGSSADPATIAAGVKGTLRAVPGKGLGFGLLNYLANDPTLTRGMAGIPRPEIVFNHLGNDHSPPSQPDHLPSVEALSGHARSPGAPRASVFEVNAWISRGRLEIALNYSRHLHHRETAEALLARMTAALSALGETGASQKAIRPTPTDFPDAGLDQGDLDRLFGQDQ